MLPQLRLDDLLAELRTRLDAVLGARDRMHGPLEAVVAIGSGLELEAMLLRILVAAFAAQAAVALELADRRDNGRGIQETGRRSGLANMADRAEKLGGRLRLSPADGGGTELEWQVPVPLEAAQATLGDPRLEPQGKYPLR